jgi:hypothetical protein
MSAAVAAHLVKVQPDNLDWWIALACARRRYEGTKSAEAVLLRAREVTMTTPRSSSTLRAMRASRGVSTTPKHG